MQLQVIEWVKEGILDREKSQLAVLLKGDGVFLLFRWGVSVRIKGREEEWRGRERREGESVPQDVRGS
jgi:hypothetical protein